MTVDEVMRWIRADRNRRLRAFLASRVPQMARGGRRMIYQCANGCCPVQHYPASGNQQVRSIVIVGELRFVGLDAAARHFDLSRRAIGNRLARGKCLRYRPSDRVPCYRKACEMPDCDKPQAGRGLCATHYQQQRRGHKVRMEGWDPLCAAFTSRPRCTTTQETEA